MKKIYFLLSLLITVTVTNVNAQLLQWNTFGNLGTETTEPSVFNDPNLSGITNLTQGAGIVAAGNANRFGGNAWWNTGNSVNSTLAEAIAGNDYIQFIVTPNVGFSFTPTSFVFTWDRSGTGPSNVTLRSSADGFATDLGTIAGIVGGAFATNTITITGLTAITTATTFRLYGYNGTATGGTGGFDIAASAVNVQLNGTTASAGSPLITVTPTSRTGFIALSGVPSAEQIYTVEGSNLTNDISIAPPAGYEISLTTAPFVPANPIPLTQTGGNVPVTNIYVRMNSVPLGLTAGNITHTSLGSNNPNVNLSGNVLAAEPTTQGVITVGAITNSTIDVTFTAGNGTRQILVIKALTAVANTPVDGTTYIANTVFGSGANLGAATYVVYNGVSGNAGNPVTVSGLIVGTQYHFALFEYNDGGTAGAENYLITPLSIADATTLTTVNIYTWAGNGGLWTVPTNWVPDRNFPATNDSLLFNDGGAPYTVTNVPNQTIGYIEVSNGTSVTLQAAAALTTLTIGNSTGDDLFVELSSSLNISSTNAFTIHMLTGATAAFGGDMTLTDGAHKITAADANGVTFFNGSTFNASTGFSSNPFGVNPTAVANSVVFQSGATMRQLAGLNPFALTAPASAVVFQPGSLYRLESGITPSVSGRTYANFELDAATSLSLTGASLLTIEDLTITQGTLNLNLTGGINIKGNISIAPGTTLGFSPIGLNILTLNGTIAQTITNSGTLTWGALENLTINNAAGVTLNSDITIGATATLALTAGILKLNAPATMITLSSGTTLTGGNSNASFVDGKVKKIGNTDFTFPVGKTCCGYVPIGISVSVGGTAADEFTAEYLRGPATLLGPITAGPGLDHVSGCDWWTLDKGIATPTSIDVTGYWSTNNVCIGTYIDDLPTLTMAHFDGAGWNSFPISPVLTGGSTIVTGSITWPGATAFSPFSLAGSTFGLNPLPITINYFNGFKQNGNHLLNWKITCSSTPSATIEMQRSTDGRNFTGIYSINATALRCQQPFDFTDNQPAKGVNYYRLKMTDAIGKITYSSIVSLLNADKGIDVMNIAPNPIVNGNFKLNISTAQKSMMQMVITDMQGRVMQKQNMNTIAGFNTVPVNVANFATGTYQLFLNTGEGRSRVLKFVVQ